jgi:hypothetical protein
MLAHRAAAKALEDNLKEEMTETFTREGARETWDLPGLGQVVGSVTHDSVAVHDMDALVDWLNTYMPHQVREVHRKEVINPNWLKDVFLAGLTPLDDDETEPGPGASTLLMNAEGTIVPGVRWVRGGGFAGAAVKPNSSTARRLLDAAKQYAIGAGEMPGLPSGESSG